MSGRSGDQIRVLLTRPPARSPGWDPPVGLLQLAAWVRDRGEAAVEVVDPDLERLGIPALADRILASRPDLVGLSVHNLDADAAHAIALVLRQRGFDGRIVFGGPYPFSFRDGLLLDRNVDFAVVGEGELALSGLLEALSGRRALGEVPGLIHRDPASGLALRNAPEVLPDIDVVPRPDFGMLGIRDIEPLQRSFLSHSVLSPSARVMPVFTSRGCPFRCAFCCQHLGDRARVHSIGRVLDDLDAYRRFGAEYLQFMDSHLGSRARLHELFKAISRRRDGLGYSVYMGVRVEVLDDEVLQAMADAGVTQISLSLDAGASRIQRRMNKVVPRDRMRDVLDTCNRLGMLTRIYGMLGYLDETEDEVRQTIDAICGLPADLALFAFPIPYPGTAFGDEVAGRGIDVYRVSRQSVFDVTEGIAAIPRERLLVLRKEAYRRFYLDPRRWARVARKLPLRAATLRSVEVPLRMMFRDGSRFL